MLASDITLPRDERLGDADTLRGLDETRRHAAANFQNLHAPLMAGSRCAIGKEKGDRHEWHLNFRNCL